MANIEEIQKLVGKGRDAIEQAPAARAKEGWEGIDAPAFAVALNGLMEILKQQTAAAEKILPHTTRIGNAAERAEALFEGAAAGTTNLDALDMITGAQALGTSAGDQTAAAIGLVSGLRRMGELTVEIVSEAQAYFHAAARGSEAADVAIAVQPQVIASADAYTALISGESGPQQ